MADTMLYKHPGIHEIHGGLFAYIVVDDKDVASKLKEGWSLSTPDAKALSEKPAAPLVKHQKVTLKQLQAELADLSE